MKKIISLILLLFTITAIFSACKQSRPQRECITFEEMPDPQKASIPKWGSHSSDFKASWVNIDTRFPKHIEPEMKIAQKEIDLIGWKNEVLSAQLIVWTDVDVDQLEVEFSDFKSKDKTLPSSIAEARFVRYVLTDTFGEGCGYRKPEDYPSSLSPDMLDNIACMNIEAQSVRPIWVTISIPQSASAGKYKAELKLYAKDQKTQTLDINLRVQNKTLPNPSQWAFYLDLWQHPAAVARTQNLPLWSDEHFEAMRPLMKMLADAGQKVITTTINKDPWNNQCYDAYADMIWWTKNADGSWTYDYTIFDRWVQFMMDLGIDNTINCYSLIPWNNEIHYIDAATKDTINIKADPGTQIALDMWQPFLRDFTEHLKQKNWLHKTNIAMDERSPKEMEATLNMLKEVAPELGISLADNHKSYKNYPYIKDMSVSADAKVDEADIEYRRANGFTTTYYVCCSDRFPNVFTFSNPAEAVYCAWYATAANYDGLLRWAYNSWVENPVTDSRFRSWSAGDTYIVYPDARSSIRFERLKEGIQDMEKVRILREALKSDPQKLNQLDSAIAKFNTIHPQEPIELMLIKAKSIIDQLSE